MCTVCALCDSWCPTAPPLRGPPHAAPYPHCWPWNEPHRRPLGARFVPASANASSRWPDGLPLSYAFDALVPLAPVCRSDIVPAVSFAVSFCTQGKDPLCHATGQMTHVPWRLQLRVRHDKVCHGCTTIPTSRLCNGLTQPGGFHFPHSSQSGFACHLSNYFKLHKHVQSHYVCAIETSVSLMGPYFCENSVKFHFLRVFVCLFIMSSFTMLKERKKRTPDIPPGCLPQTVLVKNTICTFE